MREADDGNKNRVHVSVNSNDFIPHYNLGCLQRLKHAGRQIHTRVESKGNGARYTDERLARMLPVQLSGVAKVSMMPMMKKRRLQEVLDAHKRDCRAKNYIEIAKSKLHHIKQEPMRTFLPRSEC